METNEQLNSRLLSHIGASKFSVLDADYGWVPLLSGQAPDLLSIACVRDDDVWNQLIPVESNHNGPKLCVISLHFPAHISGAGFIGWLATRIKFDLGTGVVVIGGKDKNSSKELDRGSFGVFDYWCCAAENRARFTELIKKLMDEGSSINVEGVTPELNHPRPLDFSIRPE